MKDIDFDELDKAVNSLMATAPNDLAADASVPVSESVHVIPSTPTADPVVATPAAITPEPATLPSPVSTAAAPVQPAAATSVAVPATNSAPAMRRSGRFMDMVSKPAGTIAPPAAAIRPAPQAQSVSTPSREGLTITPRNDPSPTAPVENPVTESPVDTPAVDETTSRPDEIPESSINGSAESPFLSDAVVEKRPLNSGVAGPPLVDLAAALAEETEKLQEQEAQPEPELSENSENGSDEPPLNPQVAELDSDLVAIEAIENTETVQIAEPSDSTAQVDPPSTPLGASSIPQQYATQPSTGDQTHAGIYDASQYPEPVSHPAKSKSGWMWVLWVILLLGIGAGGAVLLYNLGIIP